MAKIEYIKLLYEKSDLNEAGNPVEILINARLKFHPLDIQYKMAYHLHLFVVNAWADLESTVVLTNWDEAVLYHNRIEKNETLNQLSIDVNAEQKEVNIEEISTFVNLDSKPNIAIKVLGKLVPVFSESTKFSNNYIFNIHLK
ncbi:hypothetical protein [Muriicola sp. Z0-33]|uniref:hypothetical protein n=1 Tax=Muriicola sp. Z0-33 TaxID=2816957 RepID=UPI002238F5FC|nr:hypothetical protein [Muriicola sp. Z0-33]MCW5517700.1 hypothetical protein [Muriicola sp. Z0-33]